MEKIKGLPIFVGTKEEYDDARQKGMKIVCALNRSKGFVSHKSVVGWTGMGCSPVHPDYYFKRDSDAIYLNMIDGDDPRYLSDLMINAALRFIHDSISDGHEVFIYCSLGESRSPSIALMYMLQTGIIKPSYDVLMRFKSEYYSNYNPKRGNAVYIINRWCR